MMKRIMYLSGVYISDHSWNWTENTLHISELPISKFDDMSYSSCIMKNCDLKNFHYYSLIKQGKVRCTNEGFIYILSA